jgi:hypothetical protein
MVFGGFGGWVSVTTSGFGGWFSHENSGFGGWFFRGFNEHKIEQFRLMEDKIQGYM